MKSSSYSFLSGARLPMESVNSGLFPILAFHGADSVPVLPRD